MTRDSNSTSLDVEAPLLTLAAGGPELSEAVVDDDGGAFGLEAGVETGSGWVDVTAKPGLS